jgi:hypothetical protein
MLTHQPIRSNTNNKRQQDYQNVVSSNTDLCRMMNNCNMEKVIPVNQQYQTSITPTKTDNNTMSNISVIGKVQPQVVKLDTMKASSWDRHDSIHTASRRNNMIDDEYRQWNNMESIHSIKALSWNITPTNSGIDCKPSMSFSSNEQEMQGSSSDYNDSICSFASFGDTSFSDNLDSSIGNHSTSLSSIQHASKTFTRSFDSGSDELSSSKLVKQPSQQRLMIRGVSYRNGGNSLSKIQETSID